MTRPRTRTRAGVSSACSQQIGKQERFVMSEPRLRKDVFVALAAIAWADGQLDPDEADAIVRAAVDEGLSLEEIGEIEASTKARIDLGTIDRSGLSKEDRLFVYGVACWIARMDGQVTPEESAALAALGERLGVPERPRGQAEAIARQVAELPEGDRPARYDLAALRRILGERLRAAQESKAAGAAGAVDTTKTAGESR
jgi:tellurite resistance protein